MFHYFEVRICFLEWRNVSLSFRINRPRVRHVEDEIARRASTRLLTQPDDDCRMPVYSTVDKKGKIE